MCVTTPLPAKQFVETGHFQQDLGWTTRFFLRKLGQQIQVSWLQQSCFFTQFHLPFCLYVFVASSPLFPPFDFDLSVSKTPNQQPTPSPASQSPCRRASLKNRYLHCQANCPSSRAKRSGALLSSRSLNEKGDFLSIKNLNGSESQRTPKEVAIELLY